MPALSNGGENFPLGHAPRSSSRASLTQPRPKQSAPTTNRSRVGSEESPSTFTRTRRVSDGSTSGGVRKDILLQRMAEALQSERSKANVFQRELQNAEHEIDELANTLDEQRRSHHKTVVSMKKEISRLKKERESLVQALEAAEGVEQDEAERYLALLDPSAQAALGPEDETEEARINDASRGKPTVSQPVIDDYNNTVRAQMQERSAIRAQRINMELLKLNSVSPSNVQADDNVESTDVSRRGRPTETLGQTRRKLSKVRPHSRDGAGGIWHRSGSKNRGEQNGEKGGFGKRRPSQGLGIDDDDGYYDSGPLQKSSDSFGGRSNNGKIGKLFRKGWRLYNE
ncbi:expressed protein [Phakopsora pachyrhizi]|uniref:Expressed protein n=1 Tax=Phakopsora pachyrhizi TaxID=170000 RepID=A0AAV0AEM5_PHAPC|nr:expressed protein [Phakopsora pachyrhizi]